MTMIIMITKMMMMYEYRKFVIISLLTLDVNLLMYDRNYPLIRRKFDTMIVGKITPF